MPRGISESQRAPLRVGANSDLRSPWHQFSAKTKTPHGGSRQYYLEPSEEEELSLQFAKSSSSQVKKPSQEPKMSKGSRGWCFTLNNYSQEEQEALRNVTCAYMVFGRERGDEGTPHLQGYVHLQHQKTLTAMKKIMPRAHLEVRMGTNRPSSGIL